MNKLTAVVSALLAVGIALPSASIAAPVAGKVFRFECPNASGGTPSERLTRYSTSISGMGEENINGSKVALPIFRGVPTPGVPMDLSTGGYSHAGTLYNSHSGRVTCLYVSSLGADPFNVSYSALNIKEGYVLKSSNSKITIEVYQGVK